MSWGGSMPGAPPYPQPYTNGPAAYGQPPPPYQYGQQPSYGKYPPGTTYPTPGSGQRPPNAQPPRKKGNPIITRYPPPPGYRGPAQPHASFGSNHYPKQFQAPQPGFSQTAQPPAPYSSSAYTAPPTPRGYSPQGYGVPHQPNYPQQSYSQSQNHQWPQAVGHAHNQSYSQSQHGVQNYPPATSTYPGYPPQLTPTESDSHSPSYGKTHGWSAFNDHPQNHQYNTYSAPPQAVSQTYDPNATPTPASVHMASSQPPSASEGVNPGEKPQLFLDWDDWDFDFEGAIWPKSNEPVDPSLSLGVIIWHPAKQVTRALPATFDEAEEQALKPAPDKLDNGESVSVYFMAENSHEAFLDVRQTDEWETIKDDPIFVVFSDEDMQQNLVTLEDCIAQRDRPDEDYTLQQRDDDEEMPDASWSVMDHLEQVLSTTKNEPESINEEARASPQPSNLQEDILAKLGVTGAPKPPVDGPQPPPPYFQTAISEDLSMRDPSNSTSRLPSGLPRPPVSTSSLAESRDSLHRRAASSSYGPSSTANGHRHPIPPPPPPPLVPHHQNPWNRSNGGGGHDESRVSPAPSEGSNNTMAGSDFEPEKSIDHVKGQDSGNPALMRSDCSISRKRSYEDADHSEQQPRQQDDYTKRKRRSQVESAYSRR
ncbi:hypothetical protein ACEQ8H_003933 [Pleosporales sp. CAS-2024a]